jgi:lysophospholipase L1-like esterase
MAHPDQKVAQSARRMAHPVRHGPIWWLRRAVAAVRPNPTGAGPSSAAARFLLRFMPKNRRRWELGTVLVLLVAAAAISASMPGGWAAQPSASPSPALLANLTSVDPAAAPSNTHSPAETSPDPTLPPPSPSQSPSASASASPLPSPTPKPTAAPTKKPVAKVYTFVALGDSLTAWPADSPWPSRLDAEDGNLQLVKNAGVPGDTTAQMLARLNSDVFAYKPEVLFIMGGTNDLGHSISQSTTIANLRAIIVAANAKGIRITLITIPPNAYTGMAAEIDSLNAAITSLGNAYKLVVIDIHTPLSQPAGTYWPKYTSDGLHFSAAGAQVVANTIYNRIHRYGF